MQNRLSVQAIALANTEYNGTLIDNYKSISPCGDIDEFIGRVRDGSYSYYATRTYAWVLASFKGTADPSFNKTVGAGSPPPDIHSRIPRPATLWVSLHATGLENDVAEHHDDAHCQWKDPLRYSGIAAVVVKKTGGAEEHADRQHHHNRKR